jgi:hypothetical protein
MTSRAGTAVGRSAHDPLLPHRIGVSAAQAYCDARRVAADFDQPEVAVQRLADHLDALDRLKVPREQLRPDLYDRRRQPREAAS